MTLDVRTEQDRIARLPKWARNRIAKLEADLAYLRETTALVDRGETDTVVRHQYDVGHGWEVTGLPDGTTVVFDGDIEVQVDRTSGPNGYAVRVSTAKGRLVVAPSSSNVVYVGRGSR